MYIYFSWVHVVIIIIYDTVKLPISTLLKSQSLVVTYKSWTSLRGSSPIWASEKRVSRERASERRSREGQRLASFAQIGELSRRLELNQRRSLLGTGQRNVLSVFKENNKLKSFNAAVCTIVSFAAVFRLVMQRVTERCMMSLKTAVKETMCTMEPKFGILSWFPTLIEPLCHTTSLIISCPRVCTVSSGRGWIGELIGGFWKNFCPEFRFKARF